jgi:predicted metal-dependent hydrolase
LEGVLNGREVYGNLRIVDADIDKIAHELAHLAVKRHTWRFWKIVRIIYPEYERGKEELLKIIREESMKRKKEKQSPLS